jgi:cobalt-zinc-cadmium efflux system protein
MPHGDHHHHHGPDRGHDHGHDHASARYDRAFAIGIGLNSALVLAQIGFGLAAGSLALIADAGHNLGDVLGLAMAWGAAVLGRRPPSARRTYGYGRGSILAALTNAVVLLIGVGAIALEAVRRLFAPTPVAGLTVAGVAVAAIIINGLTAFLFMSGRKGDVNIRGAFLHMAADAGVSLAVVIGALIIRFTGWNWIDPILSLAIAAIIVTGTWGLLRESIDLAMDKMPDRIDLVALKAYLAGLPGVTEVHDLHVWSLSTTEAALTVHLVRPGAAIDDALLQEVRATLDRRFGIGHATMQVEAGDPAHPCALAPADII